MLCPKRVGIGIPFHFACVFAKGNNLTQGGKECIQCFDVAAAWQITLMLYQNPKETVSPTILAFIALC